MYVEDVGRTSNETILWDMYVDGVGIRCNETTSWDANITDISYAIVIH